MKFADTSWWVAWTLPSDARHAAALKMLVKVTRAEQVVTTDLILGETWTFLRRKAGHGTADGFLDRIGQLRNGRLLTHQVSEEWNRLRGDGCASTTSGPTPSWTPPSFRVMHDRRLREASAFDQDFAAAGYVEVR